MSQITDALTQLLKFHKTKMFSVVIFALIFLLMLFPYDDLSDLVTAQVAKATQNQVFLQFDSLGIGIFPSPSLKMSSVRIDTPTLPTLKAGHLRFSPSISSLLAFKAGFNATALDFMNGNVGVNFKVGKKIPEQNRRLQNIDLNIEQVDLKFLRKFLALPLPLNGRVNAELTASIDPEFHIQPDGEFKLKIVKLNIPASTLPTALGPMALPQLQLKTIDVKGRMVASEMIVQQATLGSSKESLSGRIKGKMGLKITRRGVNIIPVPNSYDFRIELVVKKQAIKGLALFLSFLDKYKSPTLNGNKYTFRVTANNFQAPPNLTPLATF